MKKLIVFSLGLLIGSIALLAALVYKMSLTPYGRIHPYMLVLHKMLEVFSLWNVGEGDLETIRQQMDKTRPRIAVSKTEDIVVPGPVTAIPLRIYTPEGQGPFPTIVFYHGGGFVTGSINSHDNVARQLARDTNSLVISVDYRLAPEHPFPASLEDAYAALLWAAEHAPEFNGRVDQLLTAGDSAGGNLAAAVCLLSREEKGPPIHMQILLYPSTTMLETLYDSRANFTGYVLTEKMVRYIRSVYVPNEADWKSPYASPLETKDFQGLPPAYIMTAAFDPLRDEGKLYADCLAEAGIPVKYENIEGMIHGFMTMADEITAVPGAAKFYPQPDRVYASIRQMMDEVFR